MQKNTKQPDKTTKTPEIYVVLGPTATGKSDFAVDIAKKINGEIISADSRQVYRDMDLGSGKIAKKEMRGVKHYLLDVASPRSVFSVERFQRLGLKAIEKIQKQGKTPIICGGTGFYINSLIYDSKFPNVKPDHELRKILSTWDKDKLFKELKKLDSNRAKTIDRNNPQRLIRSIEIAKALGKVPKPSTPQMRFKTEIIGLDFDDEILKERIRIRIEKRLKVGMIKEVENLHKNGVSWKRLEGFGLEYKHIALFLQNKVSKDEMIENLNRDIFKFVKRQRTWFKRNKEIKWIKNSTNPMKDVNKSFW
jgi:tRNA dimethylallyltransferase